MIELIYISLWTSITNPYEKKLIVVYIDISYQKEKKESVLSKVFTDYIGVCKIFFSTEGILEKDELQIY